MSLQQQMELESAYVMSTFGRKPVEFVRGCGMNLYDDEGREYLDFLSGIAVVSLGHCHPAVVEAVTGQAKQLIHVSNYFYIEHRGQVAERLSRLLNDGAGAAAAPWKIFFANSGAEANECAIKLARLYARRKADAAGESEAPDTIVVLEGSFHGRTLATLAATAQPSKQELFQPLPAGFASIPQNDVAALNALFDSMGGRICAVMVECIQGESGVHPCTGEFLQAIRRRTAEAGALMICDEVQCGIFRTGTPFGFQQFGIIPDIVAIAKGVASGFPMGACAARDEVAAAFAPGDHGSTFGGSNLAVAAADVTLRVLEEEGFGASVARVGAYLRGRLEEAPWTCDVRGLGLMVGCDLASEGPSAPEIVSGALETGLVINATGPRTLRFLPPLICTEADVDALMEKLNALFS